MNINPKLTIDALLFSNIHVNLYFITLFAHSTFVL